MKYFLKRMASSPNIQIGVGLAWSFSAVLVKDLTGSGLDIFLIGALRSLIGVFFLLPLIIGRWGDDGESGGISGHLEGTPPKTPWVVYFVKYLGSASLIANNFLLCWAFQHTDALTPVFFHYGGLLLVAPVSIVVLNYIPTKREWLACGLTLLGLLGIVYNGLVLNQMSVMLVSVGVCITQLCGQVCMSWLSRNDEEVEKRTGWKQSHGGQCYIICEIGAIAMGLLLSFATSDSFSLVGLQTGLKLVLLGVITWGIPNFFALLAIRSKALISLGLLWMADPIGVSLWPVLVGQDPIPAPLTWVGALLILAALVIQKVGQEKKE